MPGIFAVAPHFHGLYSSVELCCTDSLKHTGRWVWRGSVSVVCWNWEKRSCRSKLVKMPSEPCSCVMSIRHFCNALLSAVQSTISIGFCICLPRLTSMLYILFIIYAGSHLRKSDLKQEALCFKSVNDSGRQCLSERLQLCTSTQLPDSFALLPTQHSTLLHQI